MLFVEWWIVGWRCVGLLLVAVGTFSFWFVRLKRWPVRLPVWFFSALAAVSGAMVLSVALGFPNPHNYSVPVYSPSGKMAARIDDWNLSGFGGAGSSDQIFTAHGLKSGVVFSGEFRSVNASNLRWQTDSQLEISYGGRVDRCKSAFQVTARCIGR
jgi:hypothetical protein